MRQVLNLLFILSLIGCGRNHPNETKLNSDYLDKEITEREQILGQDSLFTPHLNAITKEVNNIKYLTADVENLSASINKNNAYFNTAAKKYGVDSLGFIQLYEGVPLYDIVNIIKKNHLNLLNKIIIARNKNGELMYTAQ